MELSKWCGAAMRRLPVNNLIEVLILKLLDVSNVFTR